METFAPHHQLLKSYLETYLTESRKGTSSAMARIARLPAEQFLDVSTDLHDELNRRLSNSALPFLPIRTDLPQKRNQARQKMATMPEIRFKELAAELLFEIERRFPELKEDYNIKKFSGDDISRELRAVSGKSSAEKDRGRTKLSAELDGGVGRDQSHEGVQRRGKSGDRRLRSREPIRERSREARSEGIYSPSIDSGSAKTAADYEFKIAMLEKKLKNQYEVEQELQGKMESLNLLREEKRDLENDINQLGQEMDELHERNNLVSNENSKLKTEISAMQKDLEIQKKLNNDLKAKVSSLESANKIQKEEYELLNKTVQRLEDEKEKFSRDLQVLKEKGSAPADKVTGLNNTNPTSPTRSESPATIKSSPIKIKSPEPKTPLKETQNNVYNEHPHLSSYEKYQENAAKLIEASKKEPSAGVLAPMKQVLLSCREVTEICQQIEEDPVVSEDDKESLFDIKTKLSSNLTALLQAAKEHASKPTSSTEKTIETEISKLSFCISDLFELTKIIESEKNRNTLPKSNMKKDSYAELDPLDFQELQGYLGEQIDSAARLIQELLQEMSHSDPDGKIISDLIADIAQTVDNIVYETQGTIDTDKTLESRLVNECDKILDLLNNNRFDLLDLGAIALESTYNKDIRQKLANTSYAIAKYSKELINILGG